MSLIGNIIWLICGDFVTGLGYIVGGLSICCTIIGIPFGIQSIKIGLASMAPFGKEIVSSENANNTLQTIFNIIWLFLFGWGIAIAHLVSALILGITIIGLPFAKQHIKLVNLALLPFGRELK